MDQNKIPTIDQTPDTSMDDGSSYFINDTNGKSMSQLPN